MKFTIYEENKSSLQFTEKNMFYFLFLEFTGNLYPPESCQWVVLKQWGDPLVCSFILLVGYPNNICLNQIKNEDICDYVSIIDGSRMTELSIETAF